MVLAVQGRPPFHSSFRYDWTCGCTAAHRLQLLRQTAALVTTIFWSHVKQGKTKGREEDEEEREGRRLTAALETTIFWSHSMSTSRKVTFLLSVAWSTFPGGQVGG